MRRARVEKECGQGEQTAIPREVESLGGGKEADQVCVLSVCVFMCVRTCM